MTKKGYIKGPFLIYYNPQLYHVTLKYVKNLKNNGKNEKNTGQIPSECPLIQPL